MRNLAAFGRVLALVPFALARSVASFAFRHRRSSLSEGKCKPKTYSSDHCRAATAHNTNAAFMPHGLRLDRLAASYGTSEERKRRRPGTPRPIVDARDRMLARSR